MFRPLVAAFLGACATAPSATDSNAAAPVDSGGDTACILLEFHVDADGDGYGDGSIGTLSCTAPAGATLDASDCDDHDAARFPGAPEVCNSADDDCDGEADEDAVDAATWFLDADGDDYGDASAAVVTCTAPGGFVADATDCDDFDADVHPDAIEADCADPVDYNCDGSVSFDDRDGDGWAACEECDDGDDRRNPGEVERCDGGVDEDCNGLVDDADPDVMAAPKWYRDADADGYGNDALFVEQCSGAIGFVPVGGDCDDADSWRNPGLSEVCDDEDLDEDCSGRADDADVGTDPATFSTWARDADGDGYGNAARTVTQCDPPAAYVADATDCDDGDAALSPGADETCDSVDNDCDTLVDDDDSSLIGATVYYVDADGDGWGSTTSSRAACAAPSGFVANDDDCDDADASLPDASGACLPPPAATAATTTSIATPLRFLVLADTGDGSADQYAVAAGMESVCALEGCDFVLLAGDNLYPGGVTTTTDTLWEDAFELPYAAIDLEFWAVMGNHDWDHGSDTRYLDAQVDYSAVSAKWYMPADYYARVEGDATFFGIDTEVISTGRGAAQEAWLPVERAASTTTWNLLFGHHPYLSNGPHGNARGAWESFFDTYACGEFDVYFAGHDHNLQWLEPSCGTELLVSGGGHSSYPLPGANPTYFGADSLGFLWVEIDGRSLTGVFYDEGGVELYRRTFTK